MQAYMALRGTELDENRLGCRSGVEGKRPKELWSCRDRQQAWSGMP